MRTIRYYVSDYSYGHASRAVALIRDLLSNIPGLRIIVKGAGPTLVRKGLSIRPLNRLLLTFTEHRGIDRKETIDGFRSWMKEWDTLISAEADFISGHRIDLIISDVPVHPVSAAVHAEVPGFVISNFTWEGIYHRLLPGSPEVDILLQAYHEATLALILPSSTGWTFPPQLHENPSARENPSPKQGGAPE